LRSLPLKRSVHWAWEEKLASNKMSKRFFIGMRFRDGNISIIAYYKTT
jgi:hypothetical protein